MSKCADAFKSTLRTARKAHKCCECGGAIAIGEVYRYCSGIWDGEPAAYKQCRDCGEIAVAATNASNYEEGPPFTGLRDWFLEFQYYGMSDEEWLADMAEMTGVDITKLSTLLCPECRKKYQPEEHGDIHQPGKPSV